MDRLVDKVAFITGGGSGIGLGIARAFVDAGMKVVLADIRQDHLDAALDELRERNPSSGVRAMRLDVSDRAAMAEAATCTVNTLGRIHVLVNNAGIGIEGPFNEITYEDWDFGLGVNLGGVVNGLQAFLPHIRAHGEGGHIVNTASLAAFVSMPSKLAVYAAAKSAVVALSEAIRDDLAAEHIGLSILCPGPVKSRIHEITRNVPARASMSPGFRAAGERLAQRPVSHLWMEPDEVGQLVVRAVRTNAFYVITHGEWRQAVRRRHDAILAAMPEGANPELVLSMRRSS